jgi:CRP/FNR family cyclic AMP-dependent transcriptional regulator
MAKKSPEKIVDPEWANVFVSEITQEETLEQALERIPIFSLLTGRELRKLTKIVHIRHYKPGETVIPRGVEQSGFYLVRSGSVHIVRENLDQSRTVVGTLGEYELLGEFALLDSTPRTSSIVAAKSSELIGFFKPDLVEILATNPALGCKILLRLAEEMGRSLATDYGKLRDLGYPFPEGMGSPGAFAQADPTLS